MSPVKRFLLIFFGAYFVIAIGATVMFGGPALSADYLEDCGQDHDRYLEIIKSTAYKLHRQNATRHRKEGRLAGEVDFVEEYEGREEFQAETRRIARRDLFYEFFNAFAVVVLVAWLARKPLLGFADQQIERVRARIGKAEGARDSAAKRKAAAQAKVAGIPVDQERIDAQGHEHSAEETRAIQEAAQAQLTQLDKETEERKLVERRRAALLLQRELVERSLAVLEERLVNTESEAREDFLVDEFVKGLEGMGSTGG